MASKSGRSQTARGPSQRQLRVGETLRHALSEILIREDFFDPDLVDVSITIKYLIGHASRSLQRAIGAGLEL